MHSNQSLKGNLEEYEMECELANRKHTQRVIRSRGV